MSKPKEAPIKLEFSNKYTREHSQYYYEKHQRGLEPVSYTHLDVYKRQRITRTP